MSLHNIHPTAVGGFAKAASSYIKGRPDYPAETQRWLKQSLHIGPDSKVVDLGSGTGKFLPHLMTLKADIYAVEPSLAMLEQLKQQFPHLNTYLTSATQLPFDNHSMDVVVCAQSFHWFAHTEALNEIARVLGPHGKLGLIWNSRDDNVEWVAKMNQLINSVEDNTPRYHTGEWQQVFENSLFHLTEELTFKHQHQGTVQDVIINRLLSTSFIAQMASNQRQHFLDELKILLFPDINLDDTEAVITAPYLTKAYTFEKTS